MVMLLGLARRTARKSRKHHHVTRRQALQPHLAALGAGRHVLSPAGSCIVLARAGVFLYCRRRRIVRIPLQRREHAGAHGPCGLSPAHRAEQLRRVRRIVRARPKPLAAFSLRTLAARLELAGARAAASAAEGVAVLLRRSALPCRRGRGHALVLRAALRAAVWVERLDSAANSRIPHTWPWPANHLLYVQ